MTLAALSPLYTWWLLFFALLAVIRLGALRVARNQQPPAELVAAISSWPPPAPPSGEVTLVALVERYAKRHPCGSHTEAVRWAIKQFPQPDPSTRVA